MRHYFITYISKNKTKCDVLTTEFDLDKYIPLRDFIRTMKTRLQDFELLSWKKLK
jgi:hypothetical protein